LSRSPPEFRCDLVPVINRPSDRFVEEQLQIQVRPSTALIPGVLDVFWSSRRSSGISNRIGAFEPRVFEHGDIVIFSPAASVFDVINQVAGNLGDTSAENRICKALDEWMISRLGCFPITRSTFGGNRPPNRASTRGCAAFITVSPGLTVMPWSGRAAMIAEPRAERGVATRR